MSHNVDGIRSCFDYFLHLHGQFKVNEFLHPLHSEKKIQKTNFSDKQNSVFQWRATICLLVWHPVERVCNWIDAAEMHCDVSREPYNWLISDHLFKKHIIHKIHEIEFACTKAVKTEFFPPVAFKVITIISFFLFISLFILFLSRDKIFTYECNFELKKGHNAHVKMCSLVSCSSHKIQNKLSRN